MVLWSIDKGIELVRYQSVVEPIDGEAGWFVESGEDCRKLMPQLAAKAARWVAALKRKLYPLAV